jgi:integrase
MNYLLLVPQGVITMGKRANSEGSIYRRKSDGKWVASITLDDGKRKVFYGKTQKEVKDKLAKVRSEQEQGTLITAPEQTVAQFLNDWLENTQKESVRARTYERYEEIIRLHIVPVLGRHQLQKLTAQHLQAFYTRKRKEGLSPTTITVFHSVLHKALDCAVKWSLVPRNVCELVSPPRRARFEVQTLTAEQIQKLLETARGHSMEALFCLALATGMRRGELMALKWQDIDFATNTLQIRRTLSRIPSKLSAEKGKGFEETEPKTKQSRRSVVIAPFAVEALKHHRVRQLEAKLKAGPAWQEHDYVFCTSVGTHLNPTRDILDQLKILLKQAGLPDMRFHDLRHSSATLLLSAGIHPKVVQEILGHSQISMTMDIYSHVLPTMQEEAMSKLNDIIGNQKDDIGNV